jgi:MFS family permease
MVAGPVIAGLAVGLVGPASALVIDGGSFLVAAALLVRASGLRATAQVPSGGDDRLREGLRYIARKPALRALILGEGAAFVFFYLVIPVTVVYATRSLHAGSGGYAAMLTTWGVGVAIGSAVQVRLARRAGATMILISTGAVAAGYLGTALACAASVIGGIGNGTQWASVETAVHQLVDEAFRARTAAVLESLAAIAPGAGILFGGALTALFSPRAAYLVAGAGLVGLVLAARVKRLSIGMPLEAPAEAQSAASFTSA